MPDSSEEIVAFFSYARLDWEADPGILKRMFAAIQDQTRAAMGDKRFTRWLDQERLKWGDEWFEKLREVIAGAGLFFVFLSPGWLKSKTCREEYEAFKRREVELGGKRIFVVQIRDSSPNQAEEHRAVLGELSKRIG